MFRGLEVQAKSPGDQTSTVLRTGGASKVRITNRSVHSEVRPVENIEDIGRKLKPYTATVARRPYPQLLQNGSLVVQHGRLAELAVVLRRGTERVLSGDRESRSIEIKTGGIVRVERGAILTCQDWATVRIAHPRVGE
jgi:hypothetical protein